MVDNTEFFKYEKFIVVLMLKQFLDFIFGFKDKILDEIIDDEEKHLEEETKTHKEYMEK